MPASLPHRPTKPCPTCGGSGRVVRYPRTIIVDGRAVADPFDTRNVELCGACFGATVVPDTETRTDSDKATAVKDDTG